MQRDDPPRSVWTQVVCRECPAASPRAEFGDGAQTDTRDWIKEHTAETGHRRHSLRSVTESHYIA